MSDYKLTIHMNGVEAHVYDGKQADKVFESIDAAGARGAKWSRTNIGRKTVIYDLDNICAIEYRTKS